MTFSLILLNFQSEKSSIFLQSIDSSLHLINFFLVSIISLKHLFILSSIFFSFRNIRTKTLFKSCIKFLNFFNKSMLHLIKVFHIFVSSFFSIAIKSSIHFFKFSILFLPDSFNHISKFLFFLIMRHIDFFFFCIKFSFYNANISIKLFLQASKSRIL